MARSARLGLRVLLTATLGGLTACERAAPEGGEVTPDDPEVPPIVLDAEGREHRTGSAAAGRIISLLPGATTLLLDFGEGGRLIARTDDDLAQSVAHLPSLGPASAPDLEAVGLLRPDLVIHAFDAADRSTADALDRLGVTRFPLRAEQVEDGRAMVEILGDLTGQLVSATAALHDIDEALAFVRGQAMALPPARVALIVADSPLRVAGPGTLAHELIRTAGGVNVFADLTDLYPTVDASELAARGVDVFLVLNGVQFDPDLARGRPIRNVAPAVLFAGPRVGVMAYEVARALHPSAFP